MPNTHNTLTDLFTDIADAIRLKNGSTAKIVADTFPTEIKNLKTGFDYNNQEATAISDYEFYDCDQLNNVNCYGLTSIGTSAFENCTRLETIILYDGVTSIGENAFKGCDGLTIYCEAESKPEGWNDNWNPDNYEVIWGFAPVETWDISDTEEDNVIAKLYHDVQNQDMYSLVISGNGNMKNYGLYIDTPWYSYKYKISHAVIPDSVISIGEGAFEYCINLTSIVIPDSITSISYCAFSHCTNLTSITIPDSVTSIGQQAFSGCTNLTSINIPDSVTSIGPQAFYDCSSLTSINIPDSVTSIGNDAFENTSYYNNFSNWENGVLYIGNHLIEANSTLSGEYNIKDGVISISNEAFYGCISLTSITIPDSLTSIGYGVFYYCPKLTSITYTGTIAQWNVITFGNKWNYETPDYIIHCTDGDIAKDGTIITP